MISRFLLSFFVNTFLLFFADLAYAQVYNCNGRWTNVPCGGDGVSKTTSGSPRYTDAELKSKREKESALHELRMAVLKFRDDFKENFEIKDIEKKCADKTITTEECKTEISSATDKLEKRRAELQLVKSQNEANAIQERANKIQEERNKIESEKSTVVIKKEVIVLPPRRDLHVPRSHSHGEHDKHNDRHRDIDLETTTTEPTPHPLPKLN